MKGIIFVKFSEFVETRWSYQVLDQMLQSCELPSHGIYVTTMTYDDQEMLDLLTVLADLTGSDVNELLVDFGRWLFPHLHGSLHQQHAAFNDVFDALRHVQSVIHTEVRKLSPSAILPNFIFLKQTDKQLIFEYQSPRNLAKLCEGLILGVSDYSKQTVEIEIKQCEHEQQARCIIEVTKINEQ